MHDLPTSANINNPPAWYMPVVQFAAKAGEPLHLLEHPSSQVPQHEQPNQGVDFETDQSVADVSFSARTCSVCIHSAAAASHFWTFKASPICVFGHVSLQIPGGLHMPQAAWRSNSHNPLRAAVPSYSGSKLSTALGRMRSVSLYSLRYRPHSDTPGLNNFTECKAHAVRNAGKVGHSRDAVCFTSMVRGRCSIACCYRLGPQPHTKSHEHFLRGSTHQNLGDLSKAPDQTCSLPDQCCWKCTGHHKETCKADQCVYAYVTDCYAGTGAPMNDSSDVCSYHFVRQVPLYRLPTPDTPVV